jgi:hypothetical protein
VKSKQVLLALLLFFGAGSLKSQDIPPPNPGLVINIVSGWSIEFVFDEFIEYHNGINTGQATFIRIGSIYDWKLQFKADQLTFIGVYDAAHHMELNNLGLLIESIGTNQDDGSNIINNAKYAQVALESSDITILTKGNLTNKGYGIENSFTLNWEMGTMQGNMNTLSIFDQMAAGLVDADTYTVNVILTLSIY